MSIKIVSIVLALMVAAASAEFATLSFSGNITVSTATAADFYARATTFTAANLAGIAKGFSYKSVKITGAGAGQATVDAVIGGGIVTANIPPILFLGYVEEDISFDTGSLLNFNASGQANFMATSYLRVVEKTAAGVEVKVNHLVQSALDASAGVDWTFVGAKSSGSAGAELKWATFRGTPFGASWHVDLTVVTSNVVGVLDETAAHAVVSPKALEVIIEIANYPYGQATNTLSLAFVSCSGSASASATSVVSGTGAQRMFMYVDGGARINGASGTVTVEAWADLDVTQMPDAARNMLSGKFGANYNCKLGGVKFPANAASIVWDPSLGVGATAQESKSDAFAILPSLAVLAVSAMALFL